MSLNLIEYVPKKGRAPIYLSERTIRTTWRKHKNGTIYLKIDIPPKVYEKLDLKKGNYVKLFRIDTEFLKWAFCKCDEGWKLSMSKSGLLFFSFVYPEQEVAQKFMLDKKKEIDFIFEENFVVFKLI